MHRNQVEIQKLMRDGINDCDTFPPFYKSNNAVDGSQFSGNSAVNLNSFHHQINPPP